MKITEKTITDELNKTTKEELTERKEKTNETLQAPPIEKPKFIYRDHEGQRQYLCYHRHNTDRLADSLEPIQEHRVNYGNTKYIANKFFSGGGVVETDITNLMHSPNDQYNIV